MCLKKQTIIKTEVRTEKRIYFMDHEYHAYSDKQKQKLNKRAKENVLTHIPTTTKTV